MPGPTFFAGAGGLKNKAGPGPGKNLLIVYHNLMSFCKFSLNFGKNEQFFINIVKISKFLRASRVFI